MPFRCPQAYGGFPKITGQKISFGLTLCLKVGNWTMHGKKTNKAAKKRFSVTAKGKIKRTKAGKNHILTKKTAKRKNNLAKAGYVHEADEGRVRRLLGIK
jgi:large subunit ribosomal protein L35